MAFLPDMNGLPTDSVGKVAQALGGKKDEKDKQVLPPWLSMGLGGMLINGLFGGGGNDSPAPAPEQSFQPQNVSFMGGAPAAPPPSGGFGRIGRGPRMGV